MSLPSAQAAVESAELAYEQAKDALAATMLRAPAAGTIASISSSVGDTVSGSSSSASTRPHRPVTRPPPRGRRSPRT